MAKKIGVCAETDFSQLTPDNPEPPTCKVGHGWSMGYMEKNDCPDYKESLVHSLEEVKERLRLRRGE